MKRGYPETRGSYELNDLRGKIEEQRSKINNSEMLETVGVRLEEEIRQFKLEGQMLKEQLLETKRLFVNAGNQRESCRRQFEMFNRELKDAKIQAESKTREYVALVDEQECLTLELENAKEDIRKLRSRLRTEQT